MTLQPLIDPKLEATPSMFAGQILRTLHTGTSLGCRILTMLHAPASGHAATTAKFNDSEQNSQDANIEGLKWDDGYKNGSYYSR